MKSILLSYLIVMISIISTSISYKLRNRNIIKNISKLMMSTMDNDKLIRLCKDYINNSNNHNVDLCLKDFNENTEYISSSVGIYIIIISIINIIIILFTLSFI